MSVSSLSTAQDGSLDMWEVDSFGSEESHEVEPPAHVLKNNHGVSTFVFAQFNNNVSAASSMVNLTPTHATNFFERINQNEHLVIKNRSQVERIYNEDGLMGLFSLFFTPELMKDIIRWTKIASIA